MNGGNCESRSVLPVKSIYPAGMALSSILLKGGTVLFHEKDDHVSPLRNTDVLIEGNIIKKIAPSIAAHPGTKTIDCTGKIVSPGFIDTHHHVWQTQLKGRFSDDALLDYMPKGNLQSFSYTPEDIFWGQLGGCLEAIDAGITFVVDHAHMTYSPNHATEALSATASSGLRSFFCYNFTPRLKSWTTEIVRDMDLVPDWFMKQLEELAAQQPFGDGRVYLGWAFDLLFLPKEIVVPMYEQVRQLGIKLITTHVVKNAIFGMKPIQGSR
jgi:cytosine/adenosine deaminase-related metal-dependent hydrolase